MRTAKYMALLLVGSLFASAPALAVDNGFYLGGSVGGASTKISDQDISFDETDFAWKIYGGYQLLSFLALEADYRSFGSPSKNFSGFGNVEVEPTGVVASVLAGLPLGPLYVFGKVGALFWNVDLNSSCCGSDSDDGTDFGAGIGASFDIAKIRLRGEIEYFDVEDGVVMYTVGGAWLF